MIASLALTIPATAAPVAKEQPAPEAAKPAADAKAPAKPFIGLGTSDVPAFLGKHLKLPEDSGILVRDLAPDGPAAKAGLEIDDVITELDGKQVGSHQDMVDHILAKQPGDKVTLKFIHEGSPADATVTLGERPAEMDQPENAMGIREGIIEMPGMPGNLPPEIQKQIREAMENGRNGNAMKLQINPRHLEGGANGFNFDMASSINLMDDEGMIEMKTSKDGKEVRVRDKEDKEVWSGPWDTAQDMAAAPPAIRERIERLKLPIMPQIKINPGLMHEDDPPDANQGKANPKAEDNSEETPDTP